MAQFQVIQPETTYTGSPIQALQKGLPRQTQSLCPDCSELIDARIFEDGGKVVMEKHCKNHGDFRDIVYGDAKLYLKMEEWTFGDNRGLETVRKMLQALRDQRPVPCRIVQFSGGEPTIYPRFLDVLRLAKEMGFSHTQVATNGLKFTDLAFAEQCKEAGLHTLYLQFDGVCDDVYRRTRGESLWEKKLQCIENVKRAGLKIVFVPTIVKGLNDHEIGDIIRLALEYIDCTSGISFQPVAFTGRIAKHELEAKRFTLSDFAHAVQQQTGIADPYEDWFPLSCVTPFSKLLSALRGEETTTLSCHPHCSLGTYLFVDQNRKAVPVTQFVEVGPMLREMDELSRKAGKRRFQFFTKFEAWNSLRKFFHEEKAPEGLTFTKFLQTLQGMTDKSYGRGESEAKGFTYKTLMLAGMHFMDSYNYDVERVKRCVIHYAAPNGKIYPFCAYNSGPVYRERIEREFSIPFEQQPAMKALKLQGKKGAGITQPELVG
jgi:uncharacterized radical SAM superfamily Fe-S cluster-containing enzyme